MCHYSIWCVFLLFFGLVVPANTLGNYTVFYGNKILGPNEKITLPSKIYGKHTVIDAFPFNGEPTAELRLNYLEDVVDLFVAVDSWYTFSGIRKPGLETEKCKSWFEPLVSQGKMIRIVINVFPIDMEGPNLAAGHYLTAKHEWNLTNAWHRERFQRNIVGQVLMDHLPSEETYVLLSMDSDEIPRKESIKNYVTDYDKLDEGQIVVMMFFYYSFKWIKGGPWPKAVITNDRYIRTHTEKGLDHLRGNQSLVRREDDGWHCSYCLSVDSILQKVKSFSHADLFVNVDRYWIQRCVNEGLDILNRTGGDIMKPYDGRRGLPLCPKCDVYKSYG